MCWAYSDNWLCTVFHVPSTVQRDLNYILSYRHCEILLWPIYRWEKMRGTQQCGSKSSGNYSAVGFQLRSLSTQHPLITLFCFSKMSGETDSRPHYQKATVEWRFHHSWEPSGPLAACPTFSPPVPHPQRTKPLTTVLQNFSWIHKLLSLSFHFWNTAYTVPGSPWEWKQHWAKTQNI